MPPVYLDRIELEGDCTRLVVYAMGSLSETCSKCGGSSLEVRSIFLQSRENATVVSTWCNTCGNCARLTQEYPASWHRRILERVGSQDGFVGSRCGPSESGAQQTDKCKSKLDTNADEFIRHVQSRGPHAWWTSMSGIRARTGNDVLFHHT